MISHIFGLFSDPVSQWKKLAQEPESHFVKRLVIFLFFAMVPPICFFIGTTQVGWSISGEDPVRITAGSAIPLAVLFYLALLGGVIFLGLMFDWMSKTYDADSSPYKAVVFMFYATAPIYLASVLAVYPVWWVDILAATAALSYSIRLMYLGVPDMLKVPEDRGFLYASAGFMMALVYMVVVLTATVILWEFVATPVFTN